MDDSQRYPRKDFKVNGVRRREAGPGGADQPGGDIRFNGSLEMVKHREDFFAS